MAYIGLSPVVGEFRKLDDISSQFNDANTVFNLTVGGSAVQAGSSQNLVISIDGVIQEPQTAYIASGSSITFTEAPNTASAFFGVLLGSVNQVGVPSDDTVTSAKLQNNSVIESRIAANAVTEAKVASNAITERQLSANAVTAAKIANGAVTTDKVGSAAITSEKLAALSNVTITGGNITSANIFNVGFKIENVISTSNVISLNYANATVFTCTATEATTITPTNFPDSGVALLKLRNGGNFTISYAANAQFAGGIAPSLTSSGLDHLFFEGNSTIYTVTSILDIQED